MKSLKRVLLVLLVIAIFAISSSFVFATEFENDLIFIEDEGNNTIDINNLLWNNTTNDTLNNTTNDVNNTINDTTNDVANNLINSNTNLVNNTNDTNTNNANSSTYNNSSNNSNLPKAGSNDGFVLTTIMIVFGAMALYAYKKIRDYNLK